MYRSTAMAVVICAVFIGICVGGVMDHHFAMEVVKQRETKIAELSARETMLAELNMGYRKELAKARKAPAVKHKVHHRVTPHQHVAAPAKPVTPSASPFGNPRWLFSN